MLRTEPCQAGLRGDERPSSPGATLRHRALHRWRQVQRPQDRGCRVQSVPAGDVHQRHARDGAVGGRDPRHRDEHHGLAARLHVHEHDRDQRGERSVYPAGSQSTRTADSADDLLTFFGIAARSLQLSR